MNKQFFKDMAKLYKYSAVQTALRAGWYLRGQGAAYDQRLQDAVIAGVKGSTTPSLGELNAIMRGFLKEEVRAFF